MMNNELLEAHLNEIRRSVSGPEKGAIDLLLNLPGGLRCFAYTVRDLYGGSRNPTRSETRQALAWVVAGRPESMKNQARIRYGHGGIKIQKI